MTSVDGDGLERDLAEVSRMVRAGLRDAREVEEEANEQLLRKESDLLGVVVEAMHRGQPLRVRVGRWQFAGSVVHAAEDLVIIDDAGGAQVDLRLSALSELWVQDPVPGTGRAHRGALPASFADCLEGLEATGRAVELGGVDLTPAPCRVAVVARDHLVVAGRGLRRVVPLEAIGFILRR